MNKYILWFCFILLLNGCRKDIAPTNPCERFQKTSAEFVIQEELVMEYNKETGQNISCDTVLAGYDVYFTALQDFDSYTWRVVGDPVFVRTGKQFKIWFDEPMVLQIQLIARRKPNLHCDPYDTGIDTFTRQLVVLYSDKSLIVGTFEGYEVSKPNDRYTFSVTATKIPDASYDYTWQTVNFPNGCRFDLVESNINRKPLCAYKMMYVSLHFNHPGQPVMAISNVCGSPKGWFIANGNDIEVTYTTIRNPDEKPLVFISNKFVGIRK
jgi:hypothetical protein